MLDLALESRCKFKCHTIMIRWTNFIFWQSINIFDVHDAFDKKMKAVKFSDVHGIEKEWANIYMACAAHGNFRKKREVNLKTWLLESWEWKNFVRKWWSKHNNEEWCNGISYGIMKRMQKAARARGNPISSYYTVDCWLFSRSHRRSWAILSSEVFYENQSFENVIFLIYFNFRFHPKYTHLN